MEHFLLPIRKFERLDGKIEIRGKGSSPKDRVFNKIILRLRVHSNEMLINHERFREISITYARVIIKNIQRTSRVISQ